MDNTDFLRASEPLRHIVSLLCFRGRPINHDVDRRVHMIVNHGYVVGFSPDRLQPLWAAYRVSASVRDVDYERPHLFYDDPRIPEDWQIGTRGFGALNGKRYDRGHLVPNYAINTQFGRLAQMETFFMTNISPQRDKMNRGTWMKLEKLIIRDFAPAWEHIWVITGPIFSRRPRYLVRANRLRVAIPKSYFAILVDPIRYPHNEPSNVFFLALEIPQTATNQVPGDQHVTTIGAIEEATQLQFFSELNAAQKQKVAERTATRMWQTRSLTDPN